MLTPSPAPTSVGLSHLWKLQGVQSQNQSVQGTHPEPPDHVHEPSDVACIAAASAGATAVPGDGRLWVACPLVDPAPPLLIRRCCWVKGLASRLRLPGPLPLCPSEDTCDVCRVVDPGRSRGWLPSPVKGAPPLPPALLPLDRWVGRAEVASAALLREDTAVEPEG
jgi:hypothetical protein